MSRYLNTSDYSFVIQNIQLQQVLQIQPNVAVGANPKLLKAELTAIDEIKSYLVQRWDCNAEFTDTPAWSYTKSYNAADRVILDYNSFSASVNYSTGSTVIYNSNAYLSTTINSATTSTPDILGTWNLLGPQYQIFYANFPQPLFNIENFYNIGDKVYWNGHTYSCLTATTILDTTSALQYQRVEWLPLPNIIPDSLANKKFQYWADGGTYSVPAGTSLSNTTYWTVGDNRTPQIVMLMIDMVLYYLHKSISPQNIPDMRKEAYNQAIKVLRSASKGETSLSMRVLQPTQGLKTRFTGNIRRNNDW